VVKAFTEIKTVKKALSSTRITISQFHNRVYSLTVELVKAVDVNESAPRTTGIDNNIIVMCLLCITVRVFYKATYYSCP